MARYEVQGLGKDSGRRRKRIYSAFEEEEARRFAEADGTIIEEIQLLASDPPTEPQLEYARDLGIAVPSGASKDDVSDLISSKLDNDKPATDRHKAFAKRYRVEVTEYIGKRSLFDRIFLALKEPGREKDLVSWFVYRVYRELVHGAENAPIEGPDHQTIQEIADQLIMDESILASIRRYEGRDLIWFGEWTSPTGYVQTGGSNRTIAYKRAAGLIREKLNLPQHGAVGSGRNQEESTSRAVTAKSNIRTPKGCFSVIIVVLLILCALTFSFIWFGK
jgi:hypothetical protein